MKLCPPDSRRIVPVRVADVPLAKRRRAAETVCRAEDDPYERLKVNLIAEDPRDLIAWIAP